jgi:shikimate kinase
MSVSVSFKSATGVDLTGTVTLVIGPMGVGKTTLINGLRASKGVIVYDSDECRTINEKLKSDLMAQRRAALSAKTEAARRNSWKKHNGLWFPALLGGLSAVINQDPLFIAKSGMFFFDHSGHALIENGVTSVLKRRVIHLDASNEVLDKRIKDRYEYLVEFRGRATVGDSTVQEYVALARSSADNTRRAAGVWKSLGFEVERFDTSSVLIADLVKRFKAASSTGGDS